MSGWVLARIVGRSVLRLGAMTAVVVGLCLPLGLLFMVQRSFDVAAYQYSQFTTAVPVNLQPSDVKRAKVDFGANAYIYHGWTLPVEANGHQIELQAHVTATPEAANLSLFPLATVRDGTQVDTGWIDVSREAARALEVRPGENVVAHISPATTVTLAVRNIHDLRLDGYGFVGQIDQRAVTAADARRDVATQSQLHTSLERSVAHGEVSQQFYLDGLVAMGFIGPGEDVASSDVVTRADLLARNSESSAVTLQIALVTAVLGALAGASFMGRELVVYVQSFLSETQIVLALGASRRKLFQLLLTLGWSVLGVGVLLGGAVASVPYEAGWLAPGLPIYWRGTWMGVLVGSWGVMVVGLLACTIITRRRCVT